MVGVRVFVDGDFRLKQKTIWGHIGSHFGLAVVEAVEAVAENCDEHEHADSDGPQAQHEQEQEGFHQAQDKSQGSDCHEALRKRAPPSCSVRDAPLRLGETLGLETG